MRVWAWLAVGVQLLAAPSGAIAAPDYGLKARPVADGVWWFEGRREHFTRENGGNIVNTGFIVGPSGVVVIDTGPSRLYGEQMRAAIAAVTQKPVVQVYLTHEHPDHVLGSQAFEDVPIAALPATRTAIQLQGEALAGNLYRLVGGWMRATASLAPTQDAVSGEVTVGGRKLRLIGAQGHTGGDLAVFDLQTGTLFAGDLGFHQRAPTTPNADLDGWQASLEQLAGLPVRHLVPGHGPLADPLEPLEPLEQTGAYLRWLEQRVETAVDSGQDMPELMNEPIAEPYASWAVSGEEYRRSIVHLFPGRESRVLKPVP